MHPIQTDMQGHARFCADVLQGSAMKREAERIEGRKTMRVHYKKRNQTGSCGWEEEWIGGYSKMEHKSIMKRSVVVGTKLSNYAVGGGELSVAKSVDYTHETTVA